MKKSRRQASLLLGGMALAALFIMPQPAMAKDDFGRIVHHIEAQYHVHRQHRFVMGLAGFAVKFYHFAGVKSLKGAIFENQPFLNAGSDSRFDEIVRSAMDSGWRPMVQSWDRHSGERTYVYAQDLGRDMKVLVVSLEPTEAVVLQVKVDPEKFNDFVREASAGHTHPAPHEDAPPLKEAAVEASLTSGESWNGVCLLPEQPAIIY